MTVGVDRHELRRITAALAMHRAASLDELGGTVDAYRARDALRYRNNQAPNRYPMERVVSGETFHDVIVAVRRADKPEVVPKQFEAEERLEARFAVRERRILDHICQGLDHEAIVWGRDNGFPLSSPG